MMKIIFTCLALMLCAVLIVGCGSKNNTKKAVKKDPRKGYFHPDKEGKKINADFPAYDKARNVIYDGHSIQHCNTIQGQVKVNKCINGIIVPMSRAIVQMDATAHTLVVDQASYRPACQKAVTAYIAFMDKYQAAWAKNVSVWQSVNINDAQAARAANAAYALDNAFQPALKALAKECYTKADLDKAHKDAQKK